MDAGVLTTGAAASRFLLILFAATCQKCAIVDSAGLERVTIDLSIVA